MSNPVFLSVAIPTPLRRVFEYLPPAEIAAEDARRLQPGIRVLVPFGSREVVGVLLGIKSSCELAPRQLRPAHRILDADPVLPPALLSLCQWAADYYQHPPGEVIHAALPVLLRQGEAATLSGETVWILTTEGKGLPEDALKRAPKQAQLFRALLAEHSVNRQRLNQLGINRTVVNSLIDRGLVTQKQQPITREPPARLLRQPALDLNPEQQAAFDRIQYQGYQVYLLEGATGSGKTEIYLQAIERVLADGRQALVLVPEIGLTPQTISRFERRFGVNVAVLHSGLNDHERQQTWLAAAAGQAHIVIGTRSAIFTPLCAPGIIIVDEEHDPSFKQQDGFRYSARDLAVVRARRERIPLLLGTATPALESLHNALAQRYQHLLLTQRAGQAQMPVTDLIDIRGQPLQEGFCPALLAEMEAELARGNQALVFINRRGFAPTLMCHDCGWIAACPHCDARLTVHQQPRHLHCHHCDHQRPVTRQCPECYSPSLHSIGQGTERSESFLQIHFPGVPVYRIDRDTTRRKNAMADLLDKIHGGGPGILVGTQMLAKGHHFPKVTLVAIIDADGGLLSADFRGPERMGQLLTQVAGRAGREAQRGRVIIQSHHCEHPLMQSLINDGYHRFARGLLRARQLAQMPPYRYLALIKAESKRPENAVEFLSAARQLAEQLQPSCPELYYLGPLPAIMEKRNNRFRYQLQINTGSRQLLQRLLRVLCLQLETHPLARRARWAVDVDPQEN